MFRLLLVVLALSVTNAFAACTLKFDKLNPGVFTAREGHLNVMLNALNGTIQFDSNKTVNGFCSSGFKNYASSSKLESQIIFSCLGSAVRYQLPGSSATFSAKNDGKMACDNSALYYSQTVQYCKNTGYAYGFNVGNVSVVLAEICFDTVQMIPRFVHYIPGTRNDLVEDQFLFNPLNNSVALSPSKAIKWSGTDIIKERSTLSSAIYSPRNIYARIMDYQINEIVQFNLTAGELSAYERGLQNGSAIAWWRNLRDFNWLQVQQRINNLSYSGAYEVWTGTSGVVTIPYEARNETFSYNVDVNKVYTRHLPLYVWSLVKERNNKKDPGVVIIGVNSPFFVGERSKTVLCKDTCDKIAWMKPMNNYRTIASLGYVFCCAPNDVKKLLDGFPQM